MGYHYNMIVQKLETTHVLPKKCITGHHLCAQT